jgi:hypothetical protein
MSPLSIKRGFDRNYFPWRRSSSLVSLKGEMRSIPDLQGDSTKISAKNSKQLAGLFFAGYWSDAPL